MELEVFNISGQKTERMIALSESVFGIEPNDHAIYLDVKQNMANKRQGTHKSKEKWEISKSTKKIKRQKGTGGARAGSLKSPLFVGGGRVFGPQPREYGFKLNKKLKQLARKSALSYKAKDNEILVLEDFNFDEPKTKKFIEILKNFKIENGKVLFVLHDKDENLRLSARNLQKAKIISASDLNTYDILNSNKLVISESSVKIIENQYLDN